VRKKPAGGRFFSPRVESHPLRQNGSTPAGRLVCFCFAAKSGGDENSTTRPQAGQKQSGGLFLSARVESHPLRQKKTPSAYPAGGVLFCVERLRIRTGQRTEVRKKAAGGRFFSPRV